MKIPFTIKGEEIILTADDNNYCLARERERMRNGVNVTELEPFKWFSDIGAALNRIIDLKCKRSDAQSLQELRHVIEQSRKEVLEAWRTSA
ncbi:MAG TPA: hypothetical protein VGJ93_05665 [Desulfuromonadaceae bacterium]|jgi:hypothetical protein